MTKLEQLIQDLCPNGVKMVKLGDCCQILDNRRKPITKSAREQGEYPYYGANGIQDYVADYIFDGVFVLVGEDGSVQTKNGNPVVTWAEGKIWVNNHAHIIAEKENALLRYLFYVLQTLNISHLIHGNIPKLTKKDFAELQIPLPPLAVQSEIVRLLDKFTLYKSELAAELAARCKQYEHYRNQLLTFDENTKRVKLGEVAEIGTGSSNTNEGKEEGAYPFYVRSQTPLRKDTFEYDETAIITAGDGVGVGKVFHFVQGKYALHQRAYRIHPTDEKLNPKYLYFYMVTMFADYIHKTMFHSSVSSIRRPMLTDFPIPLPPLEIQERIVAILDRFDALCNDIKIGLPAEIELRQKQYEHYRDRLLTFEEQK